jgi:pimeloyl-ACP methyl ester carboxylesterase
VGRLALAVSPGRDDVVVVHEIGGDLRPPLTGRPWRYVQRGHAGSDRAAGHAYYTSDFVLDLLRLLRTVVRRPVRIEGWGVGGLIATLAAVAEPDSVLTVGLHAAEDGWSRVLPAVLGPASTLNQSWLELLRRGPVPPAQDHDPVLDVGPPCSMAIGTVRDATASLEVPWWSSGGHFIEELLPRRNRLRFPEHTPGRDAP